MNLSLNTIKIFCNPSHVAHPIVSLPLTANVWTNITQHSSSRPSQPEGYVWMHGDFGSKSRPFEKCKIPKMQNWKLEKNNFELKITRNCWILILLPKKRYGCNMLKRKPILRSEALPPKFFIPEQKGKVVYKVPGDPGDPPPFVLQISSKRTSVQPLHHLLNSPDQTHSLQLRIRWATTWPSIWLNGNQLLIIKVTSCQENQCMSMMMSN